MYHSTGLRLLASVTSGAGEAPVESARKEAMAASVPRLARVGGILLI